MGGVALILSGCGALDGSEVSEAVLSLLELSRYGVTPDVFAPEMQFDVVDHVTHESVGEKRSLIAEAARISRSGVKPMKQLGCDDYDALVIPGGFGVAKNFSDIATEKKSPEILPEVRDCVADFHKGGKPIVAVCMASSLVAFCLQGAGISLTLGPNDHNGMIAVSGNKHVQCEACGCVVDSSNKEVSTPAFMVQQAGLSEVHEGIHQAISTMFNMLKGEA